MTETDRNQKTEDRKWKAINALSKAIQREKQENKEKKSESEKEILPGGIKRDRPAEEDTGPLPRFPGGDGNHPGSPSPSRTDPPPGVG